MKHKITKALGTDDSVNVCDCCGRNNLKATVAFETESGEVVNYGVVCAARATGKSEVAIRAATRKADAAKADARYWAEQRAHAEKMERWVAHLVQLTGGILGYDKKPSVFRMIQAAGGIEKASVGFAG